MLCFICRWLHLEEAICHKWADGFLPVHWIQLLFDKFSLLLQLFDGIRCQNSEGFIVSTLHVSIRRVEFWDWKIKLLSLVDTINHNISDWDKLLRDKMDRVSFALEPIWWKAFASRNRTRRWGNKKYKDAIQRREQVNNTRT